MAFSRSVFTVLLLSVACNASVPVFLWGDLNAPALKVNPLTPVSSPALNDILSKELPSDVLTVIFVEDTLSNEDFSLKTDGETAFPYLRDNVGKSLYLATVENALEAFNLLAPPEDVEVVHLTEDGLSGKLDSSKFLYINLKDAVEGESRAEYLRRHNDFMETTVSELQEKYGNVVAVYTGRKSAINNRVRRQAAAHNGDLMLDGVRLYTKNIRVVEGDNSMLLSGVVSSTSEINSTSLSTKTTLNFSNRSIILNFRGAGGYWFFESVTVNPGTADALDLSPDTEVYALDSFAYRCAENVTFSNGNSSSVHTSIHFENIKVQAQFAHTNETSPLVFGDSFNCVGFFSAPIWSGLFVVFILLAIMFYGVIMMLDMKTMDRFDDPKGKTININAE